MSAKLRSGSRRAMLCFAAASDTLPGAATPLAPHVKHFRRQLYSPMRMRLPSRAPTICMCAE